MKMKVAPLEAEEKDFGDWERGADFGFNLLILIMGPDFWVLTIKFTIYYLTPPELLPHTPCFDEKIKMSLKLNKKNWHSFFFYFFPITNLHELSLHSSPLSSPPYYTNSFFSSLLCKLNIHRACELSFHT